MTTSRTLAREQWLDDCIHLPQPMLTDVSHPVPHNVKVACGPPSRAGLSRRHARRRECSSKNLQPYPNRVLVAALNDIRVATTTPKAQGTRLLNFACPTCGRIVRMTSKWLAALDSQPARAVKRCFIQLHDQFSKGHGNVTHVAWASDGRAVSASWEKTLRVWDIETGEPVRKPLDKNIERQERLTLTTAARQTLKMQSDASQSARRTTHVVVREMFGDEYNGS